MFYLALQNYKKAMEYKSIKGFTGFGQLGLLFLFLGLGFVLAAIAQLVIFVKAMPAGASLLDSNALMKVMADPKNVNAIRLSQVLGTFCLMFVPAALLSLIANGKNPFWLGFNKYVNYRQIALGFAIIFLANIAAGPLEDLSKAIVAKLPSLDAAAKKMEDQYAEQVKLLGNLKSWGEYFVAIFILAFFPAMFEELLFRGTLQNLLEKWWKAPLAAIIVSSIIFSVIHMSVYLFLSRAVLGFVLGWMFYKSRNIWVNIIAHFLNNALALTMLFSEYRSKGKVSMNSGDIKVEWWAGLLALAAIIVLFRLFNKFSEENRLRITTKEQALIAEKDPFHSIANTSSE